MMPAPSRPGSVVTSKRQGSEASVRPRHGRGAGALTEGIDGSLRLLELGPDVDRATVQDQQHNRLAHGKDRRGEGTLNRRQVYEDLVVRFRANILAC